MKSHLIEKYLTEKFDADSFVSDMNLSKKDRIKLKDFIKGMHGKVTADSIRKAVNQLKIKSESILESSEIWFGYNRALLIYVQEGEVLFSLNHEFPPGSLMDDETRQRARARGYTLLDV